MLSCTHLYFFFPVSIHSRNDMHCLLQLWLPLSSPSRKKHMPSLGFEPRSPRPQSKSDGYGTRLERKDNIYQLPQKGGQNHNLTYTRGNLCANIKGFITITIDRLYYRRLCNNHQGNNSIKKV